MPRYFPTAVVAVLASYSPLMAADADAIKFFESRIRPVFVEHCHSCHGPKKQKGGLRLDTAAGVANGGSSGDPLAAPGDPTKTLLIRAIEHADGVAAMPPKGKLSPAQIADMKRWVALGTPFPAPANPPPNPGANHWSFQPVRKPTVPTPTSQNAVRSTNPIDAFIRAKLEAAGLTSAPPADKRTLIRRATFDLTGLPPTPAEITAFLADDSPDAFATVVDRLLASPAYGERWGRHWLDVARYADSNGLDENIAHGNAWRYRDYVVECFNSDVPYDRFVREQVAGDLLPATDPAARRRQFVALGFLSLGPKVLAEADKKKMELDIVDEQLDTLGRAFLGLTLGCARCHDHKFDPVSTEDYYGLAGVFLSTKTMDSFQTIATWHENSLGTPEELKQRADYDARVAKGTEQAKKLAGKRVLGVLVAKPIEAVVAAMTKAAPDVPSAMGVTEGTIADVPVLKRGNHMTPGEIVPRRFPIVLTHGKAVTLPKDHSGRRELANWLTAPDNPLTARVMVNRVWRWHFGAGLVRSVDNFGLLGELPSHPALLDWLASEFVAQGWGVKNLHRLIMLSATYQQSSAFNPQSATKDPDNRLFWRANIRRVEAEVIRDALMAVAGTLDRSTGGPALHHVKNREFLFDHTSKDRTSYDSRRRTLYLPVIRNNLYDVLQLFDATDAAVLSGDRTTTTVATQALFWLNSPLVAESADTLAEELLTRTDRDDAGRAAMLYEVVYGRPPTSTETTRALTAIAGFERDAGAELTTDQRRQRAWSLMCHVALAANEFVYVR